MEIGSPAAGLFWALADLFFHFRAFSFLLCCHGLIVRLHGRFLSSLGSLGSCFSRGLFIFPIFPSLHSSQHCCATSSSADPFTGLTKINVAARIATAAFHPQLHHGAEWLSQQRSFDLVTCQSGSGRCPKLLPSTTS